MRDQRVIRPEHVASTGSAVDAHTRSLRAPGWLDTPGALRSLDVCLDPKGPFIDGIRAIRSPASRAIRDQMKGPSPTDRSTLS